MDATSNTGNMDSSGTFAFVQDVLLTRTVTRMCTNSVSVASPRLDTSFNLNVMSYFLFDFNHFQAVRFVANVRLFIGPESRRSILNDVMKSSNTKSAARWAIFKFTSAHKNKTLQFIIFQRALCLKLFSLWQEIVFSFLEFYLQFSEPLPSPNHVEFIPIGSQHCRLNFVYAP